MRNLSQHLGDDLKTKFVEFINNFQKEGLYTYKLKAEDLIRDSRHLMVISSVDLMTFSHEMWTTIMQNYYRFEANLNEALTNYMRELERSTRMDDERGDKERDRNEKMEYYNVGFDNIYGDELRSLKCQKLGHLIAFKGTVTRTTQVRPQLIKGVFKCLGCQQPSVPVEQQFKYTEPKKCRTMNCASGKWDLLPSLSQFGDFQKIRVQDDPSEIPEGGMPRSVEVILRNDLCDKAQPGDTCVFTGMLCVVPDIASMLKPGERTQIIMKNTQNKGNAIGMEGVTGLKQTGVKDLNYKLTFIANYVKVQNMQFKDQTNEDDEEDHMVDYSDEKEMKRIYEMFPSQTQLKIAEINRNPNKYQALAESLFPSIYGHMEVKKGIMLQLFSGVHKVTNSSISIRGDINILIVGDPSTAKSMFLKGVEQFVPRSVYTNGKTTSASGLTATVTRDENGDVGLEAGALMLADNGVCCIDQFDKMDTKDQVAIHEAMEQQTISIAKAGIYATLNARTSILAAANPLFGRYDKSRALKHNINLSAPIMSRFDLFFVICDEPDTLNDTHISEFIIGMHRGQENALDRIYQPSEIRDYIKFARKIKPRLTVEAADLLRKCYRQLRSKQKDVFSSYRVTVRQLESMIRLSEALARLQLSFVVLPEYVQQAYRLISCCIVKLQKTSVDLEEEQYNLTQRFGNLGLDSRNPDQNLVQRQMREQQVERKTQTFSISYQIYSDFQRNIVNLFKDKEAELNTHMRSDEPLGIEQGDIVNYLIGINLNDLQTIDEMEKSTKLINSVIKKLIEDQRMLVVLTDDADVSKRVLHIHPNHVS